MLERDLQFDSKKSCPEECAEVILKVCRAAASCKGQVYSKHRNLENTGLLQD